MESAKCVPDNAYQMEGARCIRKICPKATSATSSSAPRVGSLRQRLATSQTAQAQLAETLVKSVAA